MNTQAIQYQTQVTENTIAALIKRIRGFFARINQRPATTCNDAESRQGDLLRSMPLEDKLRLGMYNYMD